MHSIKNIAVVGIGGVGGFVGGKLAQLCTSDEFQGKVSFVARGAHAQKIANEGLTLHIAKETFKVSPSEVIENISQLKSPDLVILATKSYDLESVAEQLDKVIRKDTLIMPLLNGIDIHQRIRKVTSKGIILPSCIYIASFINAPGEVTVLGAKVLINTGHTNPFEKVNKEAVLSLFEKAGLKLKWNENPFLAIWEKYAFVASFAIVSGSTRQSFIEMVNEPASNQAVREVMNEIISLAKAKDIILPADFVEKSMETAFKLSPDAKTSFLRDIESGKGLNEADIFGETVIRLGKELGISTPVTSKMVQGTKF